MKLYKYLSAKGASPLKTGLVRFTQAPCLNDPFEMSPRIECVRTEASLQADITDVQQRLNMDEIEDSAISEFKSKLSRRERRVLRKKDLKALLQLEKCRSGKTDARLMTEMRAALTGAFRSAEPQMLNAAQRAVRENFGVFCLTDRPDNLLMWSHYADALGGYVIEFDESHPFFHSSEDEPSGSSSIRRVRYANEPPTIEQFIDERNSIESLFFVKGKPWEYESEWRMVRPLNSATQVVETPLGPAHLFPFPADAVTAVIIGERASTDTQEELRMIVATDAYRNVAVMVAHASHNTFNVEIA